MTVVKNYMEKLEMEEHILVPKRVYIHVKIEMSSCSQ